MKVEAATIEELIERSPRPDDLAAIDALVARAAPQLRRRLFSGPSITMIGYGELTWTNMSGSGTWPLIAIAPQKHQISVYVAAEVEGEPLVDVFDGDLGRVTRGKTCVRFTRFANLEPDGWMDLIDRAVHAATEQDRIFGRNCAFPVERPSGGTVDGS